jgi:hypothetical protein
MSLATARPRCRETTRGDLGFVVSTEFAIPPVPGKALPTAGRMDNL